MAVSQSTSGQFSKGILSREGNFYQRFHDWFQETIIIPSVLAKKPTKWGLKAWVLVESATGYTWNFQVYAGKENDCDDGALLEERVVLELTKSLWNKGHHIYCDNFYTSPSLCLKLEEKGTGCCGTVRINCKGIPISFQQKKLKKGKKSHTKMGQ